MRADAMQLPYDHATSAHPGLSRGAHRVLAPLALTARTDFEVVLGRPLERVANDWVVVLSSELVLGASWERLIPRRVAKHFPFAQAVGRVGRAEAKGDAAHGLSFASDQQEQRDERREGEHDGAQGLEEHSVRRVSVKRPTGGLESLTCFELNSLVGKKARPDGQLGKGKLPLKPQAEPAFVHVAHAATQGMR